MKLESLWTAKSTILIGDFDGRGERGVRDEKIAKSNIVLHDTNLVSTFHRTKAEQEKKCRRESVMSEWERGEGWGGGVVWVVLCVRGWFWMLRQIVELLIEFLIAAKVEGVALWWFSPTSPVNCSQHDLPRNGAKRINKVNVQTFACRAFITIRFPVHHVAKWITAVRHLR